MFCSAVVVYDILLRLRRIGSSQRMTGARMLQLLLLLLLLLATVVLVLVMLVLRTDPSQVPQRRLHHPSFS